MELERLKYMQISNIIIEIIVITFTIGSVLVMTWFRLINKFRVKTILLINLLETIVIIILFIIR